jgi:phytanoyl-CoA hydroxylase
LLGRTFSLVSVLVSALLDMATLTSSALDSGISQLREHGFFVARNLVTAARCGAIRQQAEHDLGAAVQPLEFEADLRYPGAPASREEAGGGTVRRLLDAYGRADVFRDWATEPQVRDWMAAYFGEQAVLSRAHHNCVMTKHPTYGSLTGWHRDIRYWSFGQSELVSTWLALGPETSRNGGLWLVPGSHAMALPPASFDAKQFLIPDQPDNAALIAGAVSVELNEGDVLFFHCKTLHAAGRNESDKVKLSVVHTYHGIGNPPVPGTRSAAKPEVVLD